MLQRNLCSATCCCIMQFLYTYGCYHTCRKFVFRKSCGTTAFKFAKLSHPLCRHFLKDFDFHSLSHSSLSTEAAPVNQLKPLPKDFLQKRMSCDKLHFRKHYFAPVVHTREESVQRIYF